MLLQQRRSESKSGVFRNIDPHPLTARRVCTVYPPAFGAGEGHTRWVERRWGLEDARHCSVLYICKDFVSCSVRFVPKLSPTETRNRQGDTHAHARRLVVMSDISAF